MENPGSPTANRTSATAAIAATAVPPAHPVGDGRRALGSFLRARRGRVEPEQVGLVGGGRRRVRGLRREELAQLAGISVDYYVRLEQGRALQPSREVLDALARALGLDPAERRHLATLAGSLAGAPTGAAAGGSGRGTAGHGRAPRARVSPLLRRVLDSLADGLPAFVTDHHLNVVAWNPVGAELIGGVGESARRDPNQARFVFLDPASRRVHPEWEVRAAEAVGQLRVAAGLYPEDVELAGLIAELSGLSSEFRRIWDSGEVVMCVAGRKRLHHPAVGLLELDFEPLNVPAAPGETGLVVHVFSAEPGTAAADGLTVLAAVAAAAAPAGA